MPFFCLKAIVIFLKSAYNCIIREDVKLGACYSAKFNLRHLLPLESPSLLDFFLYDDIMVVGDFMLRISEWKDYECIDAGNGEKLERWGSVILRRPEPQAMWGIAFDENWNKIDGFYHRSDKGGGYWDFKNELPDYWTVTYKDLKFKVNPTNFKHTGLFPEQATNWDFMMDKIKKAGRSIKVLNLFAYTGAASMACAKAGASVVQDRKSVV